MDNENVETASPLIMSREFSDMKYISLPLKITDNPSKLNSKQGKNCEIIRSRNEQFEGVAKRNVSDEAFHVKSKPNDMIRYPELLDDQSMLDLSYANQSIEGYLKHQNENRCVNSEVMESIIMKRVILKMEHKKPKKKLDLGKYIIEQTDSQQPEIQFPMSNGLKLTDATKEKFEFEFGQYNMINSQNMAQETKGDFDDGVKTIIIQQNDLFSLISKDDNITNSINMLISDVNELESQLMGLLSFLNEENIKGNSDLQTCISLNKQFNHAKLTYLMIRLFWQTHSQFKKVQNELDKLKQNCPIEVSPKAELTNCKQLRLGRNLSIESAQQVQTKSKLALIPREIHRKNSADSSDFFSAERFNSVENLKYNKKLEYNSHAHNPSQGVYRKKINGVVLTSVNQSKLATPHSKKNNLEVKDKYAHFSNMRKQSDFGCKINSREGTPIRIQELYTKNQIKLVNLPPKSRQSNNNLISQAQAALDKKPSTNNRIVKLKQGVIAKPTVVNKYLRLYK